MYMLYCTAEDVCDEGFARFNPAHSVFRLNGQHLHYTFYHTEMQQQCCCYKHNSSIRVSQFMKAQAINTG